MKILSSSNVYCPNFVALIYSVKLHILQSDGPLCQLTLCLAMVAKQSILYVLWVESLSY